MAYAADGKRVSVARPLDEKASRAEIMLVIDWAAAAG